MENFEKEKNIDGEFKKINRVHIEEASNQTQKYFNNSISEDAYQDPDLDAVFDKDIFNNQEVEIIRDLLDKKYLEKIKIDISVEKDLLSKLTDQKNKLLQEAVQIEKKINIVESKFERDRLQDEIRELKFRVDNFKAVIKLINEKIPLSEKDEDEETDPFYFSKN